QLAQSPQRLRGVHLPGENSGLNHEMKCIEQRQAAFPATFPVIDAQLALVVAAAAYPHIPGHKITMHEMGPDLLVATIHRLRITLHNQGSLRTIQAGEIQVRKLVRRTKRCEVLAQAQWPPVCQASEETPVGRSQPPSAVIARKRSLNMHQVSVRCEQPQ